jgi:hypothetical protein
LPPAVTLSFADAAAADRRYIGRARAIVAQWLGQFTGRTHRTAVSDAEQLLENAVAAFNQASAGDRAKKAKAVRVLAKRVFSARARFLRASIAATTDPMTAEVVEEHALQVARLENRLAGVTAGGVEAIVGEFAGAATQDILVTDVVNGS